jgi:hypothetical protein
MPWSKLRKQLYIVHIVFLMLVITPFFLWEQQVLLLATELIPGQHKPEVAIATVGLLAADVFLPVPSSVVGMSATVFLG